MSKTDKKYVPVNYVWHIVEDMRRLEKTNHKVTRKDLADICNCSVSTIGKMLHLVEEEQYSYEEHDGETIIKEISPMRFENKMLVKYYEPIIRTIRAALIAEGLHAWNEYDSPQRREVRDKMHASLDQIIELLSDDAVELQDLENYAWKLYRMRYPRRPAFYDYTPPDLWTAGFTRPGSAVWDNATDAERQAWIECWKQAKAAADKLVEQHIEAERLHKEAETAADTTNYTDPTGGEPWNIVQQQRDAERRLHWKAGHLNRWLSACPGSTEYDCYRYRIELEIEWQSLNDDLAEDDA